ncbi:cytochrome b/b6 domain-containing protein [Rhodocista pekingensis]|uniref:Cytochrome b/b6 domain-containing protein n=1 Tax=Rhodocista pekingensis TaxID=201185 RepID=A0ABW2KQL3_9PROT
MSTTDQPDAVMSDTIGADAAAAPAASVRVWDPLVRVSHWTLALAVAVAWISSDDASTLHLTAGFTVLTIVAVRSFWGLAGSPHARFDDFVPTPAGFFAYCRDLIGGHARRYIGHTPAGGAMIVALLACLLLTTATGVGLQYGVPGDFIREHDLEEIHEAAATGILVLVGLHVAGVLLTGLMHGENLVRAMLTGRKHG